MYICDRKPCLDTKKRHKTMYFERKAYLTELISAEGNGMIKIITGIRRFPLGEELDCLEENVKGGRTTGVNRVNS